MQINTMIALIVTNYTVSTKKLHPLYMLP